VTNTVKSALKHATALLQMAGINGADRDAKLLMAHVLQVGLAQLNARLDNAFVPPALFEFEQAITLRGQHKPVSQITGKRHFWMMEFLVTEDVLDPRPDTEALVALALEKPFARVLELGTGSGAIVLSLLAEMPKASAVATDISQPALDVAQHNADRLALSDRVQFLTSDWFDQVEGQFDLIICNPPYISEHEMQMLAPEISEWEPRIALTPEGDGLACYRIIAKNLSRFLTSDGRAIFEIGHTQEQAVNEIFRHAGFDKVSVHKDLSDHNRIIAINTHSRAI